MIDFHSHFLPGIDDGSKSVEESLEMLALSWESGVDRIVATPHFYASKESPDHFLARREQAWERLAAALPDESPLIWLGAEVYYYTGISRTEDLERLCIGGTNVLLLEMPFHRWSAGMIEEAIDIARGSGLIVLMAHIDRYLPDQTPDTWERLQDNGILFQVNASYFLDGWSSRRKALKLLREGQIEVLGSDCHNMTSRRPNLAEAIAIIEKKAGSQAIDRLEENALRLLEG
ncbi:MAG: capsular polysaccharide biosynthesis protein [Lachnospiraceae bacterium]|nr:capsular polysaccharide biosynthesis protein [Lachnospiraceae bacterium]